MARRTKKSTAAFERARKVLVGGVNSPVRAFTAVAGSPPTIARATGAAITDIDGNTYIDYVGSYGPAILGHAPESVVTAICKATGKGTSYGAPTEAETALAEMVCAAIPSVEKVRFVSSGTEAAMTAVRLARGATGRPKIIKCIGCYHGHVDALLVQAGSGATTLGIPSSPGIPAGATNDTILVDYNDLSAVEAALAKHTGQVAAIIVEPIAGNMGVIGPRDGYLPGLRSACDKAGALLILDEVMTGFRVAYSGAQGLYGVRPDLSILGKVIGGGMPIGAVAGPAELMKNLAPEGPVYQAGTLSGNPVAMTAGLATLQVLQQEGFYEQLEARSAELEFGLRQAAGEAGLDGKICFNRVGSMMSCFFTPGPVESYADATIQDLTAFAEYFCDMLVDGIYLAPSAFEAMFVSAAHSDEDIKRTCQAARSAFSKTAKIMENPSVSR